MRYSQAATRAWYRGDDERECPVCGSTGYVPSGHPFSDDPERDCDVCGGAGYVAAGVSRYIEALLADRDYLRSRLAAAEAACAKGA